MLRSYLHELFLHDIHLGAAFHGQQLQLYERHGPQQLMAFLRGSPHYPLDLALEICRANGFVEEQVFVLGRMGAYREAIALLLDKLGDFRGALRFVRCSNEQHEMFQALVAHAMTSPPLVAALLQHMSSEPLITLSALAIGQQVCALLQPGAPLQATIMDHSCLRHPAPLIVRTAVAHGHAHPRATAALHRHP